VDEQNARRFYVALLLFDLMHEVAFETACRSFGLEPGLVYQLQDQSAMWCGSLRQFLGKLGRFALLGGCLQQLQLRLQYGAKEDIVQSELLELPGVSVSRARSLLEAGFSSLQLLACADPAAVARQLADSYNPKSAGAVIKAAKARLRQKAEELVDSFDAAPQRR
jgi:replicative superfamily II helicase